MSDDQRTQPPCPDCGFPQNEHPIEPYYDGSNCPPRRHRTNPPSRIPRDTACGACLDTGCDECDTPPKQPTPSAKDKVVLGWRMKRGQDVVFCPDCGFGMHADQSTPTSTDGSTPDRYECPICDRRMGHANTDPLTAKAGYEVARRIVVTDLCDVLAFEKRPVWREKLEQAISFIEGRECFPLPSEVEEPTSSALVEAVCYCDLYDGSGSCLGCLDNSFIHGAAVAFGLLGMAQAIGDAHPESLRFSSKWFEDDVPTPRYEGDD